MLLSLSNVRFAALFIISLSAIPSARAEGPAHSISEIREMRGVVETKLQMRMQEIQNGLSERMYDPERAFELRTKAQSEYKYRMDMLRREEDAAFRAADDKQRKPARGAGTYGGSNSAIPRIPSQSVKTYPVDGAPAPEETPQAEGRQQNVGLGTRELEF